MRPAGKDDGMLDQHYADDSAASSPESIVTEHQLGWVVGTLHNPKIRQHERECLLLCAGEILLDLLGQQVQGRHT